MPSRTFSRHPRLLTAALLLAGLLSIQLTASVHAAEPDAKAKARVQLQEGAEALQLGDYAHALEMFELAYATFPSPKIFFNIGLANVGLARYPEALLAFERFLSEAKDASATSSSDAKAQVEKLKSKVSIIDVVCNKDGVVQTGVTIAIDGRKIGETPLPRPVYLTSGQHQILARSAQSAPVVESITTDPGERRTVVLTLAPTTRPESEPKGPPKVAGGPQVGTEPNIINSHPAPPSAPPLYRRPWVLIAAGVAVAAVVVVGIVAASGSEGPPSPTLGRY